MQRLTDDVFDGKHALTRRSRYPKIFTGWWTVLIGGILAGWTAGYYTYGFSALFKPISSELGLGRATTSVAASIGRLEGGFEAPLSGWLSDRFGPKWVILVGIFIMGVGLLLMNFVNSLWSFYLVWGLIVGTGHNVGGQLPLDTAVANWFVKKRGLALGIKWTLSGLVVSSMLPFVVTPLITTHGWRGATTAGGLVLLFIALPLIWFSFKTHRPEHYGMLPDGASVEKENILGNKTMDRGVEYAAEVEEVEFTSRQALKTPSFWLLTLIQSLNSLAIPAVNMHGVPFMTDIGIDSVKASGILATMVLASIPTRFVGGFLADHLKIGHLRFLLGGAYLFQAAGFAAILQSQTLPMIYTWFIVYGIGYGASFTVNSAMRARYFGRKAFGTLRGLSTMMLMPVGIAAPVYLGWVYDTTGSYLDAFKWVAILLGSSGVLMSFIRPPKPPAR